MYVLVSFLSLLSLSGCGGACDYKHTGTNEYDANNDDDKKKK